MTQHETDIGHEGGSVYSDVTNGFKREAVFLCAKVDAMFSHGFTELYSEEYDRVIVRSPVLGHVHLDNTRQLVGEGAVEVGQLSREYKRHLAKQSLIRALEFTVVKGDGIYIVSPALRVHWERMIPREPLGNKISHMYAPKIEVRDKHSADQLRKIGHAMQVAVSKNSTYYIDNVHLDTA